MQYSLWISLLILSGCSSLQQTLSPDTFYKRDLSASINGVIYSGVGVINKSTTYSMIITPQGEPDLIFVRNCHREIIKESSKTLLGSKPSYISVSYTPNELEQGFCPLEINAYEKEKGRHSWAFFDFTDDKYTVKFKMNCNGEESTFNGVGVCQGRTGTVQTIYFDQPIRFADSICNKPIKKDNHYELELSKKNCLYTFDTKEGNIGRLTTIGYESVLVRAQ